MIKNINLSKAELASKKLQIASSTRIHNDKHKYFVTLNLYSRISKIDGMNAVRHFIASLSKEIFGRRSNSSLICVPVLEHHRDDGYHVHMLIEDPFPRSVRYQSFDSSKLKELVRSHWERQKGAAKIAMSCQDGNSWFKEIEDPANLAAYVTKQLPINDDVILWDLVNEDGKRHSL